MHKDGEQSEPTTQVIQAVSQHPAETPALSHTEHSVSQSEPDTPLPIERRQFRKLTPSQVQLAIRLSADGIEQRAIAKRLGVTQSAISLLLARYEPTVDAARALIQARAGKVASQWLKSVPIAARKGDHRPAKDWLIAAGVAPPERTQAQQVVIQVGDGSRVDVTQRDPFGVGDIDTSEK